jgi:uncharacterized membrane protein
VSTRDIFLNRLRAGLRGMKPAAVADIMSDYTAHFTEAAAHGRSEDEVAAKLGDPARLARELRAEAGLRRWEEQRSAGNAVGAVLAVLGLATIDLFILLPVLSVAGVVVFALFIAGACVCVAGALMLLGALVHLLPGFGGSWLQGVLLGLGVASGGASVVAFCTLFVIGTVNLLVRYGRLHYRAVAPVTDPQREFVQ